MNLRYTSSVAFAALGLAACSGDVIEPTATPRGPSMNVESSAGGSISTHMVVLKNKNAANAVATRIGELGGKVAFMHPETGLVLVHGLTQASAASLAANGGVQNVLADEAFQIESPADAMRVDGPSDAIASVDNPATAARYNFQWNMRLINADDAWAAGKLGNAGVTVAIIDSGIDYTAPDLNGLVDLTRSVSFVAQDEAIRTANFPARHPVDDFNGHGTNVATQVSSKALAVAGVTSKTTLMGVKVLGFTGSGSTAGVLAGIVHAADNGADIANMSLGSSFLKKDGQGLHSLFNKVFTYAKQKGMLIVVASGNAASDLDHNGNTYSAYCDAPGVVCVSSVGPRTGITSNGDLPAYYTNYGRSAIAIAAPGGSGDAANNFPSYAYPWGASTRSWVWSYCARNSLVLVGNQLFFAGCQAGNLLTGYVGTSQAAPHVAGMAALMLAEGTSKNNLKNAISQAVDKIDTLGNSPFYGAGRMNVAKAVGLQ